MNNKYMILSLFLINFAGLIEASSSRECQEDRGIGHIFLEIFSFFDIDSMNADVFVAENSRNREVADLAVACRARTVPAFAVAEPMSIYDELLAIARDVPGVQVEIPCRIAQVRPVNIVVPIVQACIGDNDEIIAFAHATRVQ